MFRAIFLLLLSFSSVVLNAQTSLSTLLKKHRQEFASVLPSSLQHGTVYVMDMSSSSKTFKDIDIFSTQALIDYGKKMQHKTRADLLIGRYLEDRNIYKRGEHYGHGNEERTVHLGIDLMADAGTPVYAPVDGTVHSFQDNNIPADYGPTIILRHQLQGHTFHTLYGHLSRRALITLKVGQRIKKGQQIATIGKPFENGGWPEHLHFQIIKDMQGEKGNFVGVINPGKVKEFGLNCPDPNLILNIAAL